MKHTARKWMPAAAVPVVVAAAALVAPLAAPADVDLPDKTPQQVLEMVAGSDTTAFSGDLVGSTDLGLPALPAGAGSGMGGSAGPDPGAGQDSGALPGGGSDKTNGGAAGGTAGSTGEGTAHPVDARLAEAFSLLSGSHHARVFVDGPDKARVQVMVEMDEQDVIRNGSSLWYYDSAEHTATHATLPDAATHPPAKPRVAPGMPGAATATPPELARKLLAELDPDTDVTVASGSVAGHEVYNLQLTPTTPDTLVAGVRIGVDADTGVPLSFSIAAKDQQNPAMSVAFTTFTAATPDAELFNFKPPADANVTEAKPPRHAVPGAGHGAPDETTTPKAGTEPAAPHSGATESAAPHSAAPHSGASGTTVIGEGWDAVVQVPADALPAELSNSALLNELATTVDGGRLLHTPLVNILLTTDGRAFAGAVPLATLQAAAGHR